MKGLVNVLQQCIDIFDQLEIPYAVMGGIAVRAYAIPRTTQDVDLVVTLPRDRLKDMYRGFEQSGYTVPDAYWTGWVDEVAGMAVVKPKIYLKDHLIDVDIFLAESAFLSSVMMRRQECLTEGMSLWLVSPEDLVLMKLIANRPRDRIDVSDIFFTQGDLDEQYLQHWAEPLGIKDRLRDALQQ